MYLAGRAQAKSRFRFFAYESGGGNFLDTADSYSWKTGNCGGESESIIGSWLRSRRIRAAMVVATKVGAETGIYKRSLRADAIITRVEASLRRLGTDYIDIVYAHMDDSLTSLEETLGTFDQIIRQGKARYLAISNYSLDRARGVFETCHLGAFAKPIAISCQYSLVVRSDYEGIFDCLCAKEKVACLPYWALAKGFLTGKYRPGAEVASARANRAQSYLNAKGLRILEALEEIGDNRSVCMSSVAIAWLLNKSAIVSVLASARTPEQLGELTTAAGLWLSREEMSLLDSASEKRECDIESKESYDPLLWTEDSVNSKH
jgi:aryl-alcohol dehydrogenase-like predicted oxidoreductase